MNAKAIVTATLLLLMAGCVGSNSMNLDKTERITMNKSETKTVLVKVESVQSLNVRTVNGTIDDGPIQVLDSELSPRPSHVLESYPPIWKWEREEDVETTLHLNSTDVEPGQYEYSVNTDDTFNSLTVVVEE